MVDEGRDHGCFHDPKLREELLQNPEHVANQSDHKAVRERVAYPTALGWNAILVADHLDFGNILFHEQQCWPAGIVHRPAIDCHVRLENAHGILRSAHSKSCNLVSQARSEEHTSELQSLMRISYAVF